MAVWSVLKLKLSKLLNIEWEDRETEDSYLIERILYLVRNGDRDLKNLFESKAILTFSTQMS